MQEISEICIFNPKLLTVAELYYRNDKLHHVDTAIPRIITITLHYHMKLLENVML